MKKQMCIIIPTLDKDEEVLRTVQEINSSINFNKKLAVSYFNLKPDTLKKLREYGCILIKNKNRGRGYGVINAYKKLKDKFEIFSYMDSDMPFNKKQLNEFWKKSMEGNYDLLIASKQRGKIESSLIRLITSKTYHILSNLLLFGRLNITDFQTGLKSWKTGVVEEVFKKKDIDEKWFFDTQFIYYAIKMKKKVVLFPIDSKIDAKSTINLIPDSVEFFINLLRLKIDELFNK